MDNEKFGMPAEQNLGSLQLNESPFLNWITKTIDALVITDYEKRILLVNPSYEKLTGFHSAELLGERVEQRIKSGKTATHVYREMWESLDTKGTWLGDVINKKKSGEIFHANVSITKIDTGSQSFYIGIYRDHSHIFKEQEEKIYMSRHDDLTGLPNRALFEEKVQEMIDRSKNLKQREKQFLLFFDLNGFKPINDTLGHLAGDYLLIAFANRLKENFQLKGMLGRFGGDEFVAYTTSSSKNELSKKIAQFNHELQVHPLMVKGNIFKISVSVGIAEIPKDGESIRELIKKADQAMYDSKRDGNLDGNFYLYLNTSTSFLRRYSYFYHHFN
jgi:diguanylate cyclase (GGDEF)-like protein/PAS domain S-box-containing protein